MKTCTFPLVMDASAGRGGAFVPRSTEALARAGPEDRTNVVPAGQGPPTNPPLRKPIPVVIATRCFPSGPVNAIGADAMPLTLPPKNVSQG